MPELAVIIRAAGGVHLPNFSDDLNFPSLLLITSHPETKTQAKNMQNDVQHGVTKITFLMLFDILMQQQLDAQDIDGQTNKTFKKSIQEQPEKKTVVSNKPSLKSRSDPGINHGINGKLGGTKLGDDLVEVGGCTQKMSNFV